MRTKRTLATTICALIVFGVFAQDGETLTLQEAVALARAFYELYPNSPSISVGVIAPNPAGGDTLIFSGELPPQVAAVDPATLTDESAQAFLQQIHGWWNPTVNWQG